jgi:hypothetical protein
MQCYQRRNTPSQPQSLAGVDACLQETRGGSFAFIRQLLRGGYVQTIHDTE